MNNLSPQATMPCQLLELTNDVAWTATLDGQRLLYANPAMSRVYGRPVADFYSNAGLWLEMVHPDDRAVAAQSGRELLAHHQTEATYRIVRPDGTTRWLLDRKHVIFDEAGHPQYIGGIATDITNHKQLENELRVSLEKYRVLFETLPLGVTIANAAGQITESNPAAERILGISTAEQQQREIDSPIWQIIRPDGTPLPAEEYASTRALREQRLVENMVMGVVKGTTGQISWISVTAAPLSVKGDGVVIAYVDITERVKAEEALRESKERYHSLFANSGDAILLTAPDGSVFAANPAACQMFGRTEAEICQLGRAGLVDRTDPRLTAGLERRTRSGKVHGELNLLRANGSVFPAEITSAMFRDRDGSPKTSMIIRDSTERKQMEAALLASERKFRSLIEQSPNAIFLTDETGQIIEWNQAAEQLTELPKTDVLNQMVWDIRYKTSPSTAQTPALYEQMKTNILNLLQTGQHPKNAKVTELQIKTVTGQLKVIQATVFAIKTETGNMLGNIMRDVTAQKLTEQGLRDSEEKYRALFNNELYAICIFDLETLRFLDVNAAYTRLYGYSRAELLAGTTIHNITAEPEKSDASTNQAVHEGTIFIPLRYHRKKDGTVFPVEIVGGPYTWQGRRVMFALAHDITNRQQMEAALRHSERKFRSVIEQANDAIVLVDETGQVIEWNPAAEHIIGMKRTEVLGQMVWDVQFGTLPAECQTPAFYEQLKSLLQTRYQTDQHPQSPQTHETEIQHPDGTRRTIQTAEFLVKTEHGFLRGSIIRDVTERKQAEAERERLIAELQTILAQVKQLSGLLPICANCKKIRDDHGYWQQVEVYIRDHSEADFSHSICPDCTEKLYPRAQYPFLYKDND